MTNQRQVFSSRDQYWPIRTDEKCVNIDKFFPRQKPKTAGDFLPFAKWSLDLETTDTDLWLTKTERKSGKMGWNYSTHSLNYRKGCGVGVNRWSVHFIMDVWSGVPSWQKPKLSKSIQIENSYNQEQFLHIKELVGKAWCSCLRYSSQV